MVPRAPQPGDIPPYRPHLLRDDSTHSKLSVPLSSQSNEADDEQSSDPDDPDYDMESPPDSPQYEGEDTRLTSDKELAGFYMYGWAAEVFVVCGIGSFIPVTLEQLARENGVLLADRSTPCKAPRPVTPFAPNSLDALLRPNPESGQCVVRILGVEINTASFAMYTFSISVAIQALLIISMSGAADHGKFRKKLLLTFAFIGSIATMLFLPIVPKVYILGAVLAIIANTCFGASFVLLNSFLPLLVRYHPTVRYPDSSSEDALTDSVVSEEDEQETPTQERIVSDAHWANHLSQRQSVLHEVVDASTALLPRTSSAPDMTSPRARTTVAPSQELALSTKISAYGIGIGYVAALLVQTIGMFVVIIFPSSNFGYRLVLFIVGFWWFIFTLPTARWLRPRPGPPLHLPPQTSNLRTGLAYFTYSWKSLARTATHARMLKDLLLFLAAWFLLSDSIATVSGTAVLFAKTTLGMSKAMLALINVIATLSGVLGAFTWSRISSFFRLSPTQTILCCIFIFELIPLYGLLGYMPAVQRLGYLGLQQKWEMYPLGAVYGFVLGGLSSYCRSLFGELIPRGYEAQFYALYAITDKGSSVFGPAIVGVITDRFGEIRPAFWFLAVLIGLPFPIMMLVNVDRGRAEGNALAKKLEELSRERDESYVDGDDEDSNLSQEVRSRLEESFSYQRS